MPTEPLCLFVTLRIRAGAEARAAACLEALAAASRAEPGCLAYQPHRSLADPRAFIIYELYRDRAALEAHRRTEHFARLAQGELHQLAEERAAVEYGPLAG